MRCFPSALLTALLLAGCGGSDGAVPQGDAAVAEAARPDAPADVADAGAEHPTFHTGSCLPSVSIAGGATFEPIRAGTTSEWRTVTFKPPASSTTGCSAGWNWSDPAMAFELGDNGCAPLRPPCEVKVRYRPRTSGMHRAELQVFTSTDHRANLALTGTATAAGW